MQKPPPIAHVSRYPVTGGVALLAIIVTAAIAFHWNIEPFVTYGPKLAREPWRLLTTTLPHVSVLHLLFNIYMFWSFGTLLEQHFGHLKYAALLVLLAAGSSAAEFAFLEGGVGLSGVVYGLFGMLWVLHLFDPRFTDALDKSTIVTLVGWFFLCIVLTVMNILPVANIAHGAGAILGALVGWLYVRRTQPALPLAALIVSLVLITAAATVARTTVNMSLGAGLQYATEGYKALERNDYSQGIADYRKAIAFRKTDAGWYYNIGYAYAQLDQPQNALPFVQEAVHRGPSNSQFRQLLQNLETYFAATHAAATQSTQPATEPTTLKN